MLKLILIASSLIVGLCVYLYDGGSTDRIRSVASSEDSKTVIGLVDQLRGVALVSNQEGQDQPLKIGYSLYEGDKITTKEKSFIRIKMIDQSMFNLGSNSEAVLSLYQVHNKNERDIVIELIKGMLRSHFVNKNHKGKMEVRSRGTVFGVRGTEFINIVHDNNVELILLEGKVEIITPKRKKIQINPQEYYESETSQTKILDSDEFKQYQQMCLGNDEIVIFNNNEPLSRKTSSSQQYQELVKKVNKLTEVEIKQVLSSKISFQEKKNLISLSPLNNKTELLKKLENIEKHDRYVKNVLRRIQDVETFAKLEPEEQKRLQVLHNAMTKEKALEFLAEDKAAVLITPDDKVVFFEDKPELMALLPKDESGNIMGIKVDDNLVPVDALPLKSMDNSIVEDIVHTVVPVINEIGKVVLIPVANEIEETIVSLPIVGTGDVAGVDVNLLTQLINPIVEHVIPEVVSPEIVQTVQTVVNPVTESVSQVVTSANNVVTPVNNLLNTVVSPTVNTVVKPVINTVVPTKPLGKLLGR